MSTDSENHQAGQQADGTGSPRKATTRDDVAARRRFLSMGLGLGAVGTGMTSIPTPGHAAPSAPGAVVFYPRVYGAFGDDNTDDHAALQQAFTIASTYQNAHPYHRVMVDLEGLTYRYGTPLFIYDKLTIVNGCLHSEVGTANVTITAEPNLDTYAQLTCIDVKFRKFQNQDLIGLKIVDGLRCHLERCEFDNFRNGTHGCQALVLEGVQMANIISCTFTQNDVHVHFRESSGGTPSTDCRFIGCMLVEALLHAVTSDSPQAADSKVAAASATFLACSIETCAGEGSLIQLVDVRDFRFDSCRFEGNHEGSPIVALAVTIETSRPRFVNCTFSGGGESGYEACVQFDAGVDEPIFTGCYFPVSTLEEGGRVALDAGGNYKAWGNYNLSDTALAT